MLNKETSLAKEYLILKDFDYSPKPRVIQSFSKGSKVVGMTSGAIERGKSLNAIELPSSSKSNQPKGD